MTLQTFAALTGSVVREVAIGTPSPSRRRRWAADRLAGVSIMVLLALLWLMLPIQALAQTTQVVEYYHTDALGSVRAVTNQQGQVIRRHDFMPFGEEIQPTIPPPEKRLFTGKERDAETGLDYFGARYYRADLGRFTTVDPVMTLDENLVDPQRWNRYAYVRNNPLRWADPDGRAIELLNGGKDLEFFQGLVGGEAGKLLYVNWVGKRAFLGIRGDIDRFGGLSDRASLLGMLVHDQGVIEFAQTTADLTKWAGAVTHPPGAVGNDNVRVEVNPGQLSQAQALLSSTGAGRFWFDRGVIQKATLDIVVAHEMGHAWQYLASSPRPANMSPDTNYGALAFENRARAWAGPLGANNAARIRHSGVFGPAIWPLR